MADKKLSIYERLAEARKMFHGLELKKSGHNKFAGYTYFELADFVIPGMDCMKANGLVPVVNFDREYATMTIHDFDGNAIIINSPMETANLKGCHPIQNLGAVETYQRRYLWMAALEIVEHDALDSAKPVAEEPVVKQTKQEFIAQARQDAVQRVPASDEQWDIMNALAEGNPRRVAHLADNQNMDYRKANLTISRWGAHDSTEKEQAA